MWWPHFLALVPLVSSLTLSRVVEDVAEEPRVEDLDDCVCSPFSGNPDGCCTVPKGGKLSTTTTTTTTTTTCHNWFADEPCGAGGHGQYCCNSNFESHCCNTSACTAGCRNSLEGACGCKEQPTRESVGYNDSLALRMLALNAASQCDAGPVRAWNCTACSANVSLRDINVTDNDGHSAYVGYDAELDQIVAVFRGSLSVQDWVNNLDLLKTQAYAELGCDECYVHKGFLDAYWSLQPGVEASIFALLELYPNRTIALTGHSLGAAMAAHAAVSLRLVRNLPLDPYVYTFGQPRTGDAAFARWHGAYFPGWLRVTHWNDPVPHLPPQDVGFAHFAREIWYDHASEDSIVCNSGGEDEDCSLSVAVAMGWTSHCNYLGHPVCQCLAW